MEIKEINNFIDGEILRLEDYYKAKDKNELTMAMGLKVVEEIGELFKEILGHKGYQSKSKLDKLDREEIKKEFADVIFTTLILAKRFNVDIEEAIKIKMAEIKKRDYNK
ncbi:MAG: MazG nucleotide pyrophosphohydrolase domain-containing protein [Nanoarchaeota archaeon]